MTKKKNKGDRVLEERLTKFSNLWNTALPTCSSQKTETREQHPERLSKEEPVGITAEFQGSDPYSKQKKAEKENLSFQKSANASRYSTTAVSERQRPQKRQLGGKWRNTNPEKFFFQKKQCFHDTSSNKTGLEDFPRNPKVKWTMKCEWSFIGDTKLKHFPIRWEVQ